MVYEMTVQVRVINMDEGINWYEVLLKRKPDFLPHKGFAEWELLPGCWLQVAEGVPSKDSGPLRLGVDQIEAERDRLINELQLESFEIFSREEVPVKWGSFSDPWGNRLGLFEYHSEKEKEERKQMIFANKVNPI